MSQSGGEWTPSGRCNSISDYCASGNIAVTGCEPDACPPLPDGGKNDIVAVECPNGYTPSVDEVKCQENGASGPQDKEEFGAGRVVKVVRWV